MTPSFDSPWRMNADNFTPPLRTPWGGRTILERFKRGLSIDSERAAYAVVGESWEVSVEPNFPSRIAGVGRDLTLAEALEADLEAGLGRQPAERFGGCPILVKLLDSLEPLSVQVHPSDDYAALSEHESGKPESWYIVAARPGAGLYLGLRSDVTHEQVEELLMGNGDLSTLLNFVPVAPGDCFEIGPGTIHSIGAGVTLVEPQAVIPGREGVTYRYWDWNRLYDEKGQPNPEGRPRELHVGDSLAVTNFDGAQGEDFVEQTRRRPWLRTSVKEAVLQGLLENDIFSVDRLRGRGPLTLDGEAMIAITIIEGALSCCDQTFRYGESLVLPAAALPVRVDLHDVLAIATRPTTA
jgi:mannose-6-phosphate isomerase